MKKLQLLFLTATCLLMFQCGQFYKDKKNISQEGVLYIPKGASYAQVLDSLQPFLVNASQFNQYAQSQDYDRYVKPGKFEIKKEDTNASLVERLKSGKELQVKVRISNGPTLYHMAGKAAKDIIADSAEIVKAIENHPKFAEENLDMETAKKYFIPNTYYFLWLTDANSFVNRMIKEHDNFWNEDRKNKLAETGMSELEVYTLASIVQMEAPKSDEQKMVAGAYLNRLKMGKKLEADPTSVYAYKLQNGFDQTIKRVLNKHIQTASAYNTYVVNGLPPGPICLPNTTAIDAVLSPAKHDYIYFCADPDRPGYHSFTASYAKHLQNAKKYQNWLRANNIR